MLDAVLLFNVQYWELNNLEVTNTKTAPGDYRGICVRGRDVGVLNHIVIRNSFIHDVSGVVNWIGGDVADDDPPWVKFETGWDASKRTGGIVVEIQSQNGTKTWFNDVVIENNTIADTSFGGIVFKQFEGSYGWGVRSSRTDARFTPHTNVVIRNNFLSQTNTQYGCNTIYVTGAQHVLIERNVTKDAGTSAIEAYNSDDVRIQYNETFGTVRKAGGADSNGIDADRATTATIIQYNYVHDNGDGILICQFAFGDSIVRYNVLVNNSRHGINLHSDSGSTNQTYNNLVFYEGSASANLIATSGRRHLPRVAVHDPQQHPALDARGRDGGLRLGDDVREQPVQRRHRRRQRHAHRLGDVRQQRHPPERRRLGPGAVGAGRLPGARGLARRQRGRRDHQQRRRRLLGQPALQRHARHRPVRSALNGPRLPAAGARWRAEVHDHGESPQDRGVDRGAFSERHDDRAAEFFEALQQIAGVDVGEPIVGVRHVGAFAEQ